MIRLAAAAVLVASAARAEDIDYKKLYTSVSPAVVLVYGEDGALGSIGTGSIIHKAGIVVTNAHVIVNHDSKKPFQKLFVFLKPDRITGQNETDLKRGFEAQWVAYDAALDLAVLMMKGAPADLPVVPLSEEEAGVGEATAAIGHPEHGAKWSLTTGRIGGEWSDFEGVPGKDVYQMETSVNRGNSGGPLLDGNGYMVGINTAIARRSEDGLAITGINFAIKSAVVRAWLDKTLTQVKLRKEPLSAPPPAAAVVADAEPAPLAPERPADAPTEPEQIARAPRPSARATPIAVSTPAPPPEGDRGFTSSEPPGRMLSPLEAVRWRSKQAFDELDVEMAKHKAER